MKRLSDCALPAPTASAPHPAVQSHVSAAQRPPQGTHDQPSWRSSAWLRGPSWTCGGLRSALLGTSAASAAVAGSPVAILHTEPSAGRHLSGGGGRGISGIHRGAWVFTSEDKIPPPNNG